MNKYKLSIIIPCYNCSKTIKRLLDSIVNNDLKKEEYEIIIVDDNSTDNFLKLVKPYESKANINYYQTNVEVHCPGNTRQVGLENAQGEWILFADNDDEFELNVFQKVFNTIKEKQIKYILSTSFTRYVNNNPYHDFSAKFETNSWLHGKFYNKQKLKEFNIHFKKDLISHEDLFFNISFIAALSSINEEVVFAPEIYTYKWNYREDSFSNQLKTNKKLLYIEKYLDEYIYTTSEPYFKYINDINREWIKEQICITMLMGYFYYQAGIYRIGSEYPKNNLIVLFNLKQKINKELQVTDDMLIQYIYSKPELYNKYKEDIFNAGLFFIEIQSFRDFIINL